METKKLLTEHEPDLGNYIHTSIGIGGYVIDCIFTIIGSTRVCIREEKSNFYKTNWDGGDKKHDIIKLVNAAIEIIDEEVINGIKSSSKIKPYYKDEEFTTWINQYKNIYIDKLQYYSLSKSLIFSPKC